MSLPAGWREDAAFMLEHDTLWQGHRVGLSNIVRQTRGLTRNQEAFVARLAAQYFVDAGDYKESVR